MPALSPRQRVAEILEAAAIELEGACNRLRVLGMTPQAEQVGKQAMSLAVVARSITGKPSDALALFFGIGEESAKAVAESMLPENINRAVQTGVGLVGATDASSDAPPAKLHRVPPVVTRQPIQYICGPVSGLSRH